MTTNIVEEHLTNIGGIFVPQENFTIYSNINEFQTTTTTTIENENYSQVSETTHTIVCYANEIPVVPNAIMIYTASDMTYNVGTNLYFTCQTGYESLIDQFNFITCSMNGTWSTDTINITMCQSSKLK